MRLEDGFWRHLRRIYCKIHPKSATFHRGAYPKLAFIRIRLLSKLHLFAKIAFFGIFVINFFSHMLPYCLQKLIANLRKKFQFFQAKRVSKEVYYSNYYKVKF